MRRAASPLVLMTQRRRLDAFLAEQAAAAGADFRDGVTVGGRSGRAGRSRAPDRRQPGRARRVVVGADGVNGSIARAVGARRRRSSTGSRSRATGRCPSGQRGRATIELGVVPGGYGWVFPKDGHANYGVGGWASEGPRLREHLRRLCARVGRRGLAMLTARRAAATDSADDGRRAGAGAARRRRRRAGRPVVGRRHRRGAPLGAAGGGRDRRRPPRRLRARARRSARSLRGELLEGEARARPPASGRLRGGAAAAGVARARGPADRRGRASARRTGPCEGAAPLLARPPSRVLFASTPLRLLDGVARDAAKGRRQTCRFLPATALWT